MKTINRRWLFLNAVLACVLALSLFTGIEAISQTKLGTIPEFHPELELGALQGYLDPKALPNSLALVPPPPAPGSAAYALDVEVAQNTFALRSTPRFVLAASDFDLKLHTLWMFFPAHSTSRSQRKTPHIYITCYVAPSAI